jgi:acetoin utilization deacetylase AcuC-like enzyme
LEEGTLVASQIVEPQAARVEDVLSVHTEDYVTRLRAVRRVYVDEKLDQESLAAP